MTNQDDNVGFGLTIFNQGTPHSTKVYYILFLLVFLLIIFLQAFYWIFANSAKPFVLGIPFGMFFIVLSIGIEFISLIALFIVEENDKNKGGVK